MRILVTFPGKSGDLLWMLPSARAIAETYGDAGKVELAIPGYLAHMKELLQLQPYIKAVWVTYDWKVEFSAPVRPWQPPDAGGRFKDFDHVFHLGYRGWPMERDLGTSTWMLADKEVPNGLPTRWHRETFFRPWITVPPWDGALEVVAGISEEWIELKMGVLAAVANWLYANLWLVYAPGQRHEEWHHLHDTGVGLSFKPSSWVTMAQIISASKLFLGCLSSPWVLANALGKETVIFEPAPARHHGVFWFDHPRNLMVDWDARAVVKAVRARLENLTCP